MNQKIPILPQDCKILKWRKFEENVQCSQSLVSFTVQIKLFLDNWLIGWEMHTCSQTVSGSWPPQLRPFSINRLKLETVRLALLHFEASVVQKYVLIMSDNRSAIAYVNKQG